MRSWEGLLRAKVGDHPAVHHSLLARFERGEVNRAKALAFASQHIYLVRQFPLYLRTLLRRMENRREGPRDSSLRPALEALRRIHADEMVEGATHVELYERFLLSLGGIAGEVCGPPFLSATEVFLAEHRRLVRERPLLVGLAALACGHEWAIPLMFPPITRGLERLPGADLAYWKLHVEQDLVHGDLLARAIDALRPLYRRADALLGEGLRCSLNARAALWSGLETHLFRQGRAPPQGAQRGRPRLGTPCAPVEGRQRPSRPHRGRLRCRTPGGSPG